MVRVEIDENSRRYPIRFVFGETSFSLSILDAEFFLENLEETIEQASELVAVDKLDYGKF